jgi:flagellar basal-body rod modification protein FlgD
MSVLATSLVGSASAYDAEANTRVASKALDQSDFLKLLVTQMTSQDPLNPKADLDSIAQMAQFSALEQNKSMQAAMAQMQAFSLLGRDVYLQPDAETTVHGIVDAVQIEAGTPQILVNGQSYDLSTVLSVAPAPTTPS